MIPIKQSLKAYIAAGLHDLQKDGVLIPDLQFDPQIERARQKEHGDFATNIALVLAKQAGMKPRDLAAALVNKLEPDDVVEELEIAGPGFINLFVSSSALYQIINTVLDQGADYGKTGAGGSEKIMVEFVSANPTGPLHVGHGRGAAYGDALVRVLRAAGFDAYSEYYVNDAGRQMNILALSVWLRYLELNGEDFVFPENAYKGGYVVEVARDLQNEVQEKLKYSSDELFSDLPDEKEQRMDELIKRCCAWLGDDYEIVFSKALNSQLDDIRNDLHEFGADFDCWFSEHSLHNGEVADAIDNLKQGGHLYEKEGAWWLNTTEFGDEKDRVVTRANGVHTYFASDIAYAKNKKQRGFSKLIYVWGADHHGYISRLKASFAALGFDPSDISIPIVQFAILYRGGEKVQMSTRSGEFVTLRELREEVGKDAARFFYVLRKTDQHMDFDLDLAKSRSNENPVYYVQYAHARICSVFRQLVDKNIKVEHKNADCTLLVEEQEIDLLHELARFPEVVESAARSYEPHQVAYYVRDLATRFHTYYNAHPFIASEENLRAARLALIDATRQVIANGLDLLGVSAPETM